MGDKNLPKKNGVSDELAELIERKLAENIALLKLIGKLQVDTTKATDSASTKVTGEKI
jgi:hypothetical protein